MNVFFFNVIIALCLSSSAAKYVFTIPKNLIQGKNETVCLLNVNEQSNNAKILFFVKNVLVESAERYVKKGVQECFKIKAPSVGKHGKVEENFFKVQVGVLFDSGKVIDYLEDVTLHKEPKLYFIETDKAVYKPGDDLKIRILNLDSELKPTLENLISEVKLMDKNGYTVAVWYNVTTQLGIVQLHHYLPEDIEEGLWKIEMGTAWQKFEIKKIVLPRFQIVTNYPREIYFETKKVKFRVCARYTYGLNVRGNAYVTVKIQNRSENVTKDKTHSNGHNTINEIKKLDNGCAIFAIARDKLALDVQARLKIETAVVEFGSGYTESVTNQIPISTVPYRVAFLGLGAPNPVPGMLHKCHVKLWKNYIDVVRNETKIKVCLKEKNTIGEEKEENEKIETSATGNRWCKEMKVEKDRSVAFYFVPHKRAQELSIIVTNATQTTKSDTYGAIHETKKYNLQKSPSENYISLERYGRNKNRCNTKDLRFIVHFTTQNYKTDAKITFYYIISSRDKIIKGDKIVRTVTGAKDKEPEPKTLKNFIPTNSNPYKSEKFILKINLDKLRSVVGNLKLLVYYVTEDRKDIVASTASVDVNKCLHDKANVTWSNRNSKPGNEAEMSIAALKNSLCSVTSVDKALSIQKPSPVYLSEANALGFLLKALPSTEILCISEYGITLNGDNTLKHGHAKRAPLKEALQKARKVFNKFGTALITNVRIADQLCSEAESYYKKEAPSLSVEFEDEDYSEDLIFADAETAPAEYNEYYEEVDAKISTRTVFPETWIWDLVAVGDTGHVHYKQTLPHSITNWRTNVYCVSLTAGLHLAKETEITSMQNFFLEILSPYSAKRGEMLHLQVMVFNYQNYSIPIRATLYETDGVEIAGKSKNKTEKSEINCVEAGDSVTLTFLLTGNKLGEAEISASAEIDESYPGRCGPDYVIYTKDSVRKKIVIESEGFPVRKYRSELMCTESFQNVTNTTWHLKQPANFLADTLKAKVIINVDVMGPTIQNLDDLLQMPTGCGEQIMATMAPNVHALDYMKSGDAAQFKEKYAQRALKNLRIGYQRLLKFRHSDGSFSAFGEKYQYGSTFLTAFVLRTLQAVKKHVHVDQKIFRKGLNWLQSLQLENGCFFDTSYNFQQMGEFNADDEEYVMSTPSLAAYIVIALAESDLTVPQSLYKNAKYCLNSKSGGPNADLYSLALTTYALFLLDEEPEAFYSLNKLLEKFQSENDMMWWEGPNRASSVEITAYAVLSLLKQNPKDNLAYVHSAVRWLNKQRNNRGGFYSTQDTVVALQALTQFGRLVKRHDADLSVRVNATNLREHFRVSSKDVFELREIKLPVVPSTVTVQLEGLGCVLVQTLMQYHTRVAEKYTSALTLRTSITTGGEKSHCSVQVTPCVVYSGETPQTSMAIMEMEIPTGFEVDVKSLENVISADKSLQVHRYEIESDKKINLYFGRLKRNDSVCVPIDMRETTKVNARVYNVLHVYDYYNPDLKAVDKFLLPDCEGDLVID